MHDIFIQYVYLILIILALVMLANKLRLAYPIDEDLIRIYLSLIDIEEFKIREKQIEEAGSE